MLYEVALASCGGVTGGFVTILVSVELLKRKDKARGDNFLVERARGKKRKEDEKLSAVHFIFLFFYFPSILFTPSPIEY